MHRMWYDFPVEQTDKREVDVIKGRKMHEVNKRRYQEESSVTVNGDCETVETRNCWEIFLQRRVDDGHC